MGDREASLKHRVEYGLVTFWGWFFLNLPYRAALFVGWLVALLGHYVFRYRVALVHERIREVFPGIAPRELRRIAWLSWRNFVFNVVDMFRLTLIDDDWLRRYMVDYEGTVARVRQRLSTGQGGVGVSLHMGSAEVSAVSLQRMGVDVFLITGSQKNLLVDGKLQAMRAATGIDCIPKNSGMFKQVFKRLKQGGMLAMLADLRMPTGGAEVDFLGKKAHVVSGMGLFAKRTGVKIYPSIITRVGWTRHKLVDYEPVVPDETLDQEVDIQRMAQVVFDHFDQAIREQPEQWFWYNKNWVLAPLRETSSKTGA